MRFASLFGSAGTSERRFHALSLNAFMTRLIWLCVLPLAMLAVYLAVNHVHALQQQQDQQATAQVHNVATAIDRQTGAQIAALQMLAASPLAGDPARMNEFYNESRGFREHFGGHVILADPSMQMIFNTRMPLGAVLPKLPVPKGRAAAPAVLATGKPAVGDMFLGPIAREPLVAVVVPLIRDGLLKFLLASTIETRHFQQHLDEVALPSGWSLTVLDGNGEVMARRSSPEMAVRPSTEEPSGRFVARSNVSPWSVVLEVPRNIYRTPITAATVALAAVILAVTLISVLGGRLASRRLARSVLTLLETPPPHDSHAVIAEIETVRNLLDSAAAARETAETTRRESELRFRRLFDIAPVSLCLVSEGDILVNTNERFKQTFGYGPEDVTTLSEWWQMAYPDPDYRRWVVKTWEAVRSAREDQIDIDPVEYRVTCKSGRVLTVVMSGTIVGNDFLATFFDITERKQAEQALKSSEERLRWALHAAKAGTWEWDLRTDENYWSEELWTLYGLKPYSCKASYEAWRQTVHPHDRQKTEHAVQEASRSGTELSVEWRVWGDDGSERWLMSRGQPVNDADGRAVRYIGIVIDITERKRVEVALQESQGKLKSALASMADAVFISDTEGRFLDFNNAFATFHRFRDKDECLKTLAEYPDILDVFMPNGELAPLDMWAVPRALRGETAMNAEYILRRKDTGETWNGSYSFAPICSDEGAIVGSVVVGRDVTEIKKADSALRNSLEEKVSLLKEVHHRVKNNLQIVASLLSLQASRVQDARTLEVLEDTQNKVRSMALLHEVLYRSENLARINFAAYSKELCTQLLRSFGSTTSQVKLENRIGPVGLPLEQSVPCGLIINELVCNALKHGFPDGRSGTISLDLAQTDGQMFALSVSDDGVGLPPDFDPARTSTLGLRLVSRLASQLQGEFAVEESGGTGTRFRVVFPVAENASPGEKE